MVVILAYQKGVFNYIMIYFAKRFVENLMKMIVALAEFDYDEALKEMDNK